jgi:hypothetical protein
MVRARERAEGILGIDPRAKVRGSSAMYQTKYCTVYTLCVCVCTRLTF